MAKKELTESQRAALDALLAGKSYAEAAQAAGIDRATLWDWSETDPLFKCECNRGRWEARAQVLDRIDALWSTALDAVEKALQDDDPGTCLQAAGFLLRASTLYKIGRGTGPTDVADIEADLRQSEMRRVLARATFP